MSRHVRHFGLPTLATLIVALALASIYRITKDQWPSVGYWLAVALVYFVVTLPNLIRQARVASDKRLKE